MLRVASRLVEYSELPCSHHLRSFGPRTILIEGFAMNLSRRLRLFLLFLFSLVLSLLVTAVLPIAGTAQPPDQAERLLDNDQKDRILKAEADAQNVEFVSQIGGYARAVVIEGDYAYLA